MSSKDSGGGEDCSEIKPGADTESNDKASTGDGAQSSETSEVKGELNQATEGGAPEIKTESSEEGGKKDVKVPEESADDSDFKLPKKRFRTPAASHASSDGPVRLRVIMMSKNLVI